MSVSEAADRLAFDRLGDEGVAFLAEVGTTLGHRPDEALVGALETIAKDAGDWPGEATLTVWHDGGVNFELAGEGEPTDLADAIHDLWGLGAGKIRL